ncbi:hypothetical protein BY458DRAFT_538072 [Sporodiniella umbellata]|nr:hypothetical protein BY458DRAFT_538072 [Sporodiniella umbellata]
MGNYVSLVKKPKNVKLKKHKETMGSTNNNDAVKREFHSDKSSTYWFPKDEDEHDRLTGLLKGNISSSAKNTLDFVNGVSVLDIGCGSGAWLADMSYEYPNCNVVQGLPYADNSFDFVYFRLLVYALRAAEWPIAIKEALRIIKPGGMIQFAPKDTSTICYRTITASNSFSIEMGQLPNIVFELEKMVSANSNVKILQDQCVPIDTNDGTTLAKKFAWNFLKAFESVSRYLGPRLGVNSKEEESEYLDKLKDDMLGNGFRIMCISLSAQKTD